MTNQPKSSPSDVASEKLAREIAEEITQAEYCNYNSSAFKIAITDRRASIILPILSKHETPQGLPSDSEVEMWFKGVDWENSPRLEEPAELFAVHLFLEYLRTRPATQATKGEPDEGLVSALFEICKRYWEDDTYSDAKVLPDIRAALIDAARGRESGGGT